MLDWTSKQGVAWAKTCAAKVAINTGLFFRAIGEHWA